MGVGRNLSARCCMEHCVALPDPTCSASLGHERNCISSQPFSNLLPRETGGGGSHTLVSASDQVEDIFGKKQFFMGNISTLGSYWICDCKSNLASNSSPCKMRRGCASAHTGEQSSPGVCSPLSPMPIQIPWTRSVEEGGKQRKEGCGALLGARVFWLVAAVGVSNLQNCFIWFGKRFPKTPALSSCKQTGMRGEEGTELEKSCKGLCSVAAL